MNLEKLGNTMYFQVEYTEDSLNKLNEFLNPPKAGYHIANIPKGEYGEISKIEEEIAELRDAASQGSKIMELVELSDIYGAIEGYLRKYHPGILMKDLKDMAGITRRAFQNGSRT